MRLALISDVHSNLPALEAVLASARREGVDLIHCLGDIVGYGARPNECVDRLRDDQIECLMGNHDAAAIGRLDLGQMNSYAATALEWTINQLTPANRDFLSSLPMMGEVEQALLVHASPDEPEAWHYIFNVSDASLAFRSFRQPVCFIGHTHFPSLFTHPMDGRRLINVGSVGQPRDRDPRACYGIYESGTRSFRWIRVEYPVAEASRQIIDAGLPPFLSQRLAAGV